MTKRFRDVTRGEKGDQADERCVLKEVPASPSTISPGVSGYVPWRPIFNFVVHGEAPPGYEYDRGYLGSKKPEQTVADTAPPPDDEERRKSTDEAFKVGDIAGMIVGIPGPDIGFVLIVQVEPTLRIRFKAWGQGEWHEQDARPDWPNLRQCGGLFRPNRMSPDAKYLIEERERLFGQSGT